MGKYATKYVDAWSNTYDWIMKCDGDASSARCTVCKCNFKISNAGIAAVRAHATSKKHATVEKIRSGQSSQVTLNAMCAAAIGKHSAKLFKFSVNNSSRKNK